MTDRIEKDAFGEVRIPKKRMWGAQTQRSLENFPIGKETMPLHFIYAYALIKKTAALTNAELGHLSSKKAKAIAEVCDEIREGEWDDEFPLSVWQTGSGTQTNMNMNEVIAHIANKENKHWIHPNDDVNKSQSTNDTFPTTMHLSSIVKIKKHLIPILNNIEQTLAELEEKNEETIKIGRTHLQDATPMTFAQEVSGWRKMISQNKQMIETSMESLLQLPLGGTAVGTGLNVAPDFARKAIEKINQWTGISFVESPNKFHGLASKDAFVFAHGALKSLAANAMKIANDVRWLASGPRAGLGEITIPANEPGSSIMPGKVNPTQAEALTMVSVQVMGNDTTIGVAASQGNFELNVYMPVIIYNFLQSVQLLGDSLKQFNQKCLKGIEVNKNKMDQFVNQSLMLVTALSPHIGYDNASKIAKIAQNENLTLKEAAIKSGIITGQEFDNYVIPDEMV